ncbi:metallophosphoesterase family protein [Jeotgalibaca sp. A122]|uniref:metallophosphoesterase family protein n=1 Tax=Jeotgalibaca sp. A122 TaxID=3457322 RepID=UPI003FD33B32
MKLKYNKSGNFRIIQFTDLHLGEYPFNSHDKNTLSAIDKVVQEHMPDLLIFTGDIVYSMSNHNAPNPKESFKQFIIFAESLHIPYAVTFGNHDTEEHVSREELRTICNQFGVNAVAKKNAHIVENRESYVIELLDSMSDEVKNVFYVIDSGDYSNTEHSYYAWVLPEQISWFQKTAALYKRQNPVKNNLIFQHIPLPEYWLASQNIVDGNFNEDISMNLNWTSDPDEKNSHSLPFDNGVFSPEVNSGFFLEMLLNKEVWGMFVGHDHDNSFHGIYKGIHLVYGQSTGYNTYGSEPKGARVIDLNEPNQLIRTYPVIF